MASKKSLFVFVILILVLGIYWASSNNSTGDNSDTNLETNQNGDDNMATNVLLKTNQGDIKIELFENSPVTAGNFKSLVEKGTYDGVIFHRVIDGFMIQGGDPTGTGMGDPNIPSIKDEFIEGNSNLRGTIAMANRGPNTGSSQFFINLGDNTNLNWDKQPESSKHPVFGKVIEGMDVVDKIAKVQTGAQDKPIDDVVIEKASIV